MSLKRSLPLVRAVRVTLVATAVLAGASPVAGAMAPGATQSGRNLEPPPTWKSRYDDDGAAARVHVVMRPGWHINPGASGIFWDPAAFAEGSFSVGATIFLFPAGSGDPPARVDAPYGLLFGGIDLDGPAPAYVSFMVRNDGMFRVARHAGAGIEELVGWSGHEAIATWTEDEEGTARNTLAVDFTDEIVTFWVNDQQVAELPRANVPADGLVGLRAGDGVSLHVSDLVIGPNRRLP